MQLFPASDGYVGVAEAYALKADLGGGFRGRLAMRGPSGLDVLKSEVLPDLASARYWAKCKAHEVMGSRKWAPGYGANRGNNWKMNIFLVPTTQAAE